MNIPKKKILGDWITVGENKFKIDYPLRDQKKRLQFILLSLGLTEDDNQHLKDNDIMDLDSSTQAKIILANKDYQENYIRFTVKGWDLKYNDGEDFKCVLKNGELEEKCWTEFIDAMTADELNILYSAIFDEIQFTETDKKK